MMHSSLSTWAAQTGISRPKFCPGRERSPFPGRETQRPVFGQKHSFGSKNPVKRETKNLVKQAVSERKHQKPTCGTVVLDTCATNHGPTARKPVSPKGVSRISQDFFKVPKSVTLKILRSAFEHRQVSPGRERIYLRQMFTVDQKKCCPNVQIGFGLSRTGDFVTISTG